MKERVVGVSDRCHLSFDRQGKPISVEEAAALLGDIEARRVALTEVGECSVSTVHIPFAQPPYREDRPPLIFETLVRGGEEEWARRYATEAEAVAGHDQIVAELRGALDLPGVDGGSDAPTKP